MHGCLSGGDHGYINTFVSSIFKKTRRRQEHVAPYPGRALLFTIRITGSSAGGTKLYACLVKFRVQKAYNLAACDRWEHACLQPVIGQFLDAKVMECVVVMLLIVYDPDWSSNGNLERGYTWCAINGVRDHSVVNVPR
jgi:hypothetical protein